MARRLRSTPTRTRPSVAIPVAHGDTGRLSELLSEWNSNEKRWLSPNSTLFGLDSKNNVTADQF
jgi:hypothetical protein